jgi:trk system potassium uptake protein
MDYVAAWQRGEPDVDFVVSSELGTANAIRRMLGVPGARQMDFFVGGDVQVLTFDVPSERPPRFAGRPLVSVGLPEASRVAAILRDSRKVAPGADAALEPGDRVIVRASRDAARDWSRLLAHEEPARDICSSEVGGPAWQSRGCCSSAARACL